MLANVTFQVNIWPIWPANKLAKDTFTAHFIEKTYTLGSFLATLSLSYVSVSKH